MRILKFRMTPFIFPLLLILSSSTVYGAEGGTTGATFLKYGIGARALGMGTAYSAVAKGAEALFWNPASLNSGRSLEFLLNHQPLFDLLSLQGGAVSYSNGIFGAAVGVSQLKHDDLDVLDITGAKVGEFGASDQQFVGGFSASGDRWGIGVAAKAIQSKIDTESASAFAGDFGINTPNPFSGNISHSFVVQNIGSKIKFVDQEDPLPLSIRLGTKWDIMYNVVLGLDIVSPNDDDVYGAIGSSMELSRAFSLRAGYSTERSDIDGLSGLGVGAGFKMGFLNFDYAWVPYGDIGQSHVFTILVRRQIRDRNKAKVQYKKDGGSNRYKLGE